MILCGESAREYARFGQPHPRLTHGEQSVVMHN
ncbi:hypothetical protein SAMN05660489_06395 [Pseudomonas sp. LAMO17WK12:I10]|nr:hypothetical protein H160_06415 [Pseudomonas sp. LAMO17WK12:I9]SNY54413.1 hypothetical protein SAMN05660489_06395 [Pseudomonas sp. LAMO17WK12:I10]